MSEVEKYSYNETEAEFTPIIDANPWKQALNVIFLVNYNRKNVQVAIMMINFTLSKHMRNVHIPV